MGFTAITDMLRAVRHARNAALALAVIVIILLIAAVTPLIFQTDPFDLTNLDLMRSYIPPVWYGEGNWNYPLGTDDQGRGMVLAILYGLRTSLFIGVVAVMLGMVLGVTLGLISGYVGGIVDAFIMRVAEVQLAYPALLIALIIDGIVRSIAGGAVDPSLAMLIVIVSIGMSFWVQYARTVRSSVLVERNLEYVEAAKVTGLSGTQIMRRHILPNVVGPVMVIATINLAIAIVTEATLSFLGVGMPLTQPSLGTLIRNGNTYLNSGEWWIAAWPSAVLVIFVIAVNVYGDWLRDYMNPRLKRRA